jgi:hypothetical protein
MLTIGRTRRLAPGTAYDPDPSLVRGGDQQHDRRYYAVVHQDGRVDKYDMRFATGPSVDEAKRSVLASESQWNPDTPVPYAWKLRNPCGAKQQAQGCHADR